MIINRRKFLGSAGGIVSLPYLESLLPRSAWAENITPPKRFIVYYVPNGRHAATFVPTKTGRDYELPRALIPLTSFKNSLTVLSGLDNATSSLTKTCDHARAAGPALTGIPILQGYKAINGISIDQFMVNALKLNTQFKSLQWTAAKAGVPDCGAASYYTQTLSWADANTPLGPLSTTAQAFNQLFSGHDPKSTEAQKALRLASQKSVLDFVLDDAKSLNARMNANDKVKVDEYFTSIREIERRINLSSGAACPKTPPNPPNNINHPETVKTFNELMAIAVKCDMTRIITFMLEYEVSYRVYEFLFPGQGSAGHHSLSHYKDEKAKEQLIQVETWETTMFADLAKRLGAIPEGEGTALDNTILVLWAGMGQGSSHDHKNVALAILGKGGGKINAGGHIKATGSTTGDLHVSLLNAMDVKATKFGQFGTKSIPGLLK